MEKTLIEKHINLIGANMITRDFTDEDAAFLFSAFGISGNDEGQTLVRFKKVGNLVTVAAISDNRTVTLTKFPDDSLELSTKEKTGRSISTLAPKDRSFDDPAVVSFPYRPVKTPAWIIEATAKGVFETLQVIAEDLKL